jgi:YVTN family beta-propeller protein
MEFRILGPLEASERGQSLAVGAGKQRMLLGVLLLNAGEAVSADRLIEALWGERAPASAPNSVHVYVSQLRKELGAERVLTRGRAYSLELGPEDELDAHAFERRLEQGRRLRAQGDTAGATRVLAEALELWGGSALEDFRYDDFAQEAIARLEEQRLLALEERNDAELALGRADALVPELEALVRAHPLRERPRGQLMLALYRSGRQAEALAAYQTGRRLLSDELGLEPSAELRELERAILRQDAALAAEPVPRPAARIARQRWPLVLAAAGAVVLAAAVAAVVVATRDGGSAGIASLAPNTVGEIDPESNRIVAQVPVGAGPGAIAFGGRALWVANREDRTVTRVDPQVKVPVRTMSTDAAPTGLVYTDDRVWVATSTPKLATIDPRHNYVAPATDLVAAPLAYGTDAHATVGFGAIWISDRIGLVTRVDPVSRRIASRIIVGNGASGIAAGEGAVWVANSFDGTVSRIEATNVVTATIPVGHGPARVAVGHGSVWVTLGPEGSLIRIDSSTNAVLATIPVGLRPEAVVTSPGAVWVADTEGGHVYRIDPRTNRVADTIDVGNSPNGLAAVAGSIWVAVVPRPPPTGPQAETLTVAVEFDPGPIDPALFWGPPVIAEIHYATCAKLLNYTDKPAPVGAQLRPEVARTFPEISPDGKTYTFTIRPGFRFSPPSNEPVTAQTFKETIERTLHPKTRGETGQLPYLGEVVGAKAYEAGRARNITGIVARGDKLVFHLTRASGSLPTLLATPHFCALPRGTPIDPEGLRNISSAGPYYVAAYVPNRRLVLKRNPNYHGERPRRASRIEYVIGAHTARRVADVEAGRADYTSEIPLEAQTRLRARYGRRVNGRQRYFETPFGDGRLLYFALNTSRPLFANARLRRAVAHAVDRAALAAKAGGPPTSEYLPPQLRITSSRRYQNHPDLARARKLAGGTTGTAVLYTCNVRFCLQHAAILKRDLARIGLEVKVEYFPKGLRFERASRPGAPYDLLFVAWGPDYFDPATVLQVLDGDSGLIGGNFANFDDPLFNRQFDAAERLAGPKRHRAYDTLARDLAHASPLVVFAGQVTTEFFSSRVGCQIHHPVYGVDLAALCIRKPGPAGS